MKSEKNLNKKGFTLIELLVVVAVIGILAAIILVGLGGFRASGRDAKRVSDIRNVQSGLELFFNACGLYPAANNWTALETALVTNPGGDTNCPAGPSTIGITSLPRDPSGGGVATYGYCVDNGGLSYVLGAILEQENAAPLREQRAAAYSCNPASNNANNTAGAMNCSDQGSTQEFCGTI